MKIYIAGKMGGEHCFNFERFFYWAHVLRLRGHTPLNPAEHDCMKWLEDGWLFTPDQYEDIIQYDLNLIRDEADAIFMLDGWYESPGARREFVEATKLGIEIMYEREESV